MKRIITVKYDGECYECGATLNVGDQAEYEKPTGIYLHDEALKLAMLILQTPIYAERREVKEAVDDVILLTRYSRSTKRHALSKVGLANSLTTRSSWNGRF